MLVNDSGTMIAVSTSWFIAAFNVVWYVLRRLGLRPFFTPVPVLQPVPVPVIPVMVGNQK